MVATKRSHVRELSTRTMGRDLAADNWSLLVMRVEPTGGATITWASVRECPQARKAPLQDARCERNRADDGDCA
jgi:hypothetical protein